MDRLLAPLSCQSEPSFLLFLHGNGHNKGFVGSRNIKAFRVQRFKNLKGKGSRVRGFKGSREAKLFKVQSSKFKVRGWQDSKRS